MDTNKWLKSILYGLVPHLALLMYLVNTQASKPKPLPKSIPLTVTIQKTKKIDKGKALAERSISPRGANSRKPDRRRKLDSQSQVSPSSNAKGYASKTYASLLPSPTEITITEAPSRSAPDGISSARHQWPQSLAIEGKRALIAKATSLRGLIHIPLSARSVSELGKATARIKYDSASQSLILTVLQGQALLRAMLFERLQSPESKEAISDALKTLNSSELVIALHLVQGSHLKANDDPFTWRENRLDIYLTQGRRGFSASGLHSTGGLSLAINLPDEKADRAREQDEAEYARLKHSPGYRSILTNRPL